ncbi:hypothetical protein BJV77DRAFT_1000806 [Russula vinacea]|nr:hypothetical protein BJV77DRAFT_1000806 [Russula vinacea]
MVGPNNSHPVHVFRHAWRGHQSGKQPCSIAHDSISPAKTIFTGIGVLLGVCFPPSPLSRFCMIFDC